MHPAPNAVWQIDGTTTLLATGTRATIVQVIDDHSRLDIACHAATGEHSDAVWQALSAGFERYGHPACVLSDNGAAFSGRRRQWPLVEIQRHLAALGITTIVSSVGHPQTCGKNERAHQTLQRWLAARPAPHTLTELQTLLEAYRKGYNRRRHQSLDGDTPQRAFPRHRPRPTRRARTTGGRARHPCRLVHGGDRVQRHLHRRGPTPRPRHRRGVLAGDRVTVLINDTVAASLTLDRTTRYQRTTNLSPMGETDLCQMC